MRIKHILIGALVLSITFLFAGCFNPTKSIENEIKKQTGNTVSIGDSGVNIKDNSGNTAQIGGSIKWPTSDMPSDIPQWKGALKASFKSAGIGTTVIFEKATKDEIKAYAEKIKSAGYEVTQEIDDTESYSVVMKKGDWDVCLSLLGTEQDDHSGQILCYKDDSSSK